MVGVGLELLLIRSNFEDIFVFFLALELISLKFLLCGHLSLLLTTAGAVNAAPNDLLF